jgi:cellulose synthase/poly-beta-1,6-N-acetylglucosamine synthase-like glycosyltransferase
MFEIIFIVATGFYFLQTIVFIIGATKRYSKINKADLLSISVILAARNEADNIIDCLTSLDNLVYPPGKIEIIIVDDNSTDSTGELIRNFIDGKSKFTYFHDVKQIGRLRGKTNAIANAIKISKGEIILTTDADCIVSPYWAETLASYYTPGVAMVCGYTNQFENSAFEAMQSIDFMYLLTVAAGTMNLGKPLSCIGNNMSYRRTVYDEIGGYEAIPFSVTEDSKLLMAFHNLGMYKIIYPVDAEGLVTSKACPDLQSLYWQKKRWGVGGLDSDISGFVVLASAFISHLCILLLPFMFSPGALYLAIFKFIVDYYFLKLVYAKYKLRLKFGYFAVFEIYFILYVIFLPVSLILSRKVKWKGREYNGKNKS